jgi:hypothetical protein
MRAAMATQVREVRSGKDRPASRNLEVAWGTPAALTFWAMGEQRFEEDLPLPWIQKCVEVSFPPASELLGWYVSYNPDQEGDPKQRAEVFGVTSTALLLAAMSMNRDPDGEWEDRHVRVTRIPLSHVGSVEETFEIYEPRGGQDQVRAFEASIQLREEPPEPWESRLKLPRQPKSDYGRDQQRARTATRTFLAAVDTALGGERPSRQRSRGATRRTARL